MLKIRQFAASAIALITLAALAVGPARGAEGSSEKERELVALLRSDAAPADKAVACKGLAIYGSSEAVPELARLLSDEHLASWARIALEAIPGPAADEALRKALDSAQGKLLVGVINSIGVRRDVASVEALISRLNDQEADVIAASAVALGKIGNAAAARALRPALAGAPAKARSAVAEGLVLCAERFLAEGNAAEAIEIYDAVRKADVPRQRVLEATRGAVLSRGDEGIALLVEQLRSNDKAMFQMALGTARELRGKKVDSALAEELPRAAPERGALIVATMADRKDTVVLPAVLSAAGKGPKPVRLAAIGALGRVGDVSCLSPLLEIAAESDAELVKSAKAALGDLPGENVNKEIVSRLPKAQGKTYPLLLELVGERRIDAMPELLKALDHSDKRVRTASLTSLGATVPAKNLSVLITQVVSPKYAEDSPVAQQALKIAAIRMADREACAGQLAAALDKSSVATQETLLQILGAVGGTKALHTLATAARGNDPKLQEASTKLLGEWMTIDAAPVLLDLTKSAPGEKYQLRALRGYIRIARQFVMEEPQRIQMTQKAWDASRQPADKKLVLEVLKRYPNIEHLKLAVKAVQIPELKEDATAAALAIGQKLGGTKGDEVRELLSKVGLEKVKLEIVKAEYGAGATQKDVTETIKKQAADLPMIVLASGYNETFGGDPIPGTPKQLKIQYKINGKPGEATFAENALIILPMPK